MIVTNRKMIGTVSLAIASFLNPFGYDILVFKMTQLTSDYWTTMQILYLFAALFFGLSYLSFKFKKIKIGNIALTLGLFLNPFGYDIVVYLLTLLTGDYWFTMCIMYMLALLFFSVFMVCYNINPIKKINNFLKK